MKPGKSTTFATCTFKDKTKFFLCMSTNPATIPIVARILLLPFLDKMHLNIMAYEPKPNIQTCVRERLLHSAYEKKHTHWYVTLLLLQIMTTHELHHRPKLSWTILHWSEKETFPRACFSKKQHQNIMQYQKANALLMLPQRTPYESKIDAAFVSAMFLGWKVSKIIPNQQAGQIFGLLFNYVIKL